MKKKSDLVQRDCAPFTEVQHALLFAWIAKAVCEQVGDQGGQEVIRDAVRQYGEERGRRMAVRAQSNHHALNMITYFAYSEFKFSPGGMDQKLSVQGRSISSHITKCPWYTTWDENGLLQWGCLYCRDIDSAIVRGFNPQLRLDVLGTRSNGDSTCNFIFHDTNLSLRNGLMLAYRKAIRPGAKAIQSWDYHVGHLFTTFERVLNEELGEAGHMAIESGLNAFAQRYGEQAKQGIAAYRKVFMPQ